MEGRSWARLRFVSTLGPYLLPFLLTAVATGAILALSRLVTLSASTVTLLYLLPVWLSTTWWGLGPGVAAALSVFLAFNYFFIAPYHSLMVRHSQDLLGLAVFLGVAVVTSQMVGRTRQSLAEATAREQEAIRLYELSTLLAGLQDDQAILKAVADQILATFGARRVEVVVEGRQAEEPVSVSLKGNGARGDQESHPTSQPTALIPLLSARGLVGEIRLWRGAAALNPAEERLLRTFATQGVLALERARLGQAENRARVLEESDRMKSSLLSSVSHELRSPLATIKASVSSLRSREVEWDSDARQELLAAVDEETDHLTQLVSNLLNMSRIEAGALNPEREWNVLAEIVNRVVHRMQPALRGQGRRLEIDLPEDLPLAPVDFIQMEQVFTNLISNALKYSPEGTQIRISARRQDEQFLQVRVSNQGPPVPDEHLDRIFDKFHRVTAADRITGTGLGLSICKGIIEAHGGRIWAENAPDGFTFIFTLPLSWEGEQPRLPQEQV